MKTISNKHTTNYFSPDLKPTSIVEIGETFAVEMKDCYGGQVTNESILRSDIDTTIMNQATGPIYLNKISTADILKVHIKEIELDHKGIMMTTNGLGVLGEDVQEPTTRILKVKNKSICFNEKISVPTHPMIGVIGVATEKDKIHTAIPGYHGGNMDTKDITVGSTIYFPVFQEGALLALGDLHAAMGDGELNGTGVEISGKVTLTTSKVEEKQITSPIVEHQDAFYFVASALTLDDD